MTFAVVVEPDARADMLRLFEYLIDRAEYVEKLDVADQDSFTAMDSESREALLSPGITM